MRKALVRVVALAAVVGAMLLGPGAPALAQSTININPGNVPTAAVDFAQDCAPNLGGGPFPDLDVWVFDLPGDPQTTGVFGSVTATFDTPDGPQTVTIPTDGAAIVNDMGTSKAWIRLPAGRTLTGATAEISGTAEFFVLTGTCAASRPTPTPTPAPTGTFTGNNLPLTGSSDIRILVPMTVVGAGSVGLGIVLVALCRRRNAENSAPTPFG